MNWILFGLVWSIEIVLVFGYLGLASLSRGARSDVKHHNSSQRPAYTSSPLVSHTRAVD